MLKMQHAAQGIDVLASFPYFSLAYCASTAQQCWCVCVCVCVCVLARAQAIVYLCLSLQDSVEAVDRLDMSDLA